VQQKVKLLLAEDDLQLGFIIRDNLEEAGFEVYHQQMILSGPKKSFFDRITFGLFREFLSEQAFCCGRKV